MYTACVYRLQLVRGSSERCRVLILSMIHHRTGVSALPGLRAFPRLSTGAERSLLIIGSVLAGADSSETEMNVLAVSLQRPAQRSVCHVRASKFYFRALPD